MNKEKCIEENIKFKSIQARQSTKSIRFLLCWR